jgi:hypothetical protein
MADITWDRELDGEEIEEVKNRDREEGRDV